MTADAEGSPSSAAPAEEVNAASPSITRGLKFIAGIWLALVIILLVAALVMALTAAERWAPLIQIFRDIFALILILELILSLAALILFLLQAAGFLILLKTEIKPILDNLRQTTRLSKATAQFANAHALDPIIQVKSFLAGLLAFLRELIRIRSLVASDEDAKTDSSDDPQTPYS